MASNKEKSGAVVCLSGGADSATLLYHAIETHENVVAVSVDYGQRHIKELECAANLCKLCKVQQDLVDMPVLRQLGGSPLTDHSIDVPDQCESKQATTVIPYRNTLLLTIAAGVCEKYKLSVIYLGATYEDQANYPDTRPEYLKQLQTALRLGGTIHNLEIRAPFSSMQKVEIVKYGMTLKVPYDKTWTCYKGENRPCLSCDACMERLTSFRLNKKKDPSLTKEEWQEYLASTL